MDEPKKLRRIIDRIPQGDIPFYRGIFEKNAMLQGTIVMNKSVLVVGRGGRTSFLIMAAGRTHKRLGVAIPTTVICRITGIPGYYRINLMRNFVYSVKLGRGFCLMLSFRVLEKA